MLAQVQQCVIHPFWTEPWFGELIIILFQGGAMLQMKLTNRRLAKKFKLATGKFPEDD